MITQTATGLNSRSDANPYDNSGFLPLITAPMYSVVNENNYKVFLDNKIQVCLPRNTKVVGANKKNIFISSSLEEFKNIYINQYKDLDFFSGFEFCEYVCIDTANGNMPELHNAIRQAKEIHGDNLIIMAGNVASVEAFIELAKTGVDYIRVGVGGGGGCNTTANTGIGQQDLEALVVSCRQVINRSRNEKIHWEKQVKVNEEDVTCKKYSQEIKDNHLKYLLENTAISKVKIVADGISTYIKQCESKYGFNDNGYAAINKLLFAGADLVMVGKLFAQCLESAGEKKSESPVLLTNEIRKNYYIKPPNENELSWKIWDVKYSGMSTQEEQRKYKIPVKMSENSNSKSIKPSEGSVNWIPVRWTLHEWLHGSDNQDQYPYLMGWVNSIKSAMAYTNKTSL